MKIKHSCSLGVHSPNCRSGLIALNEALGDSGPFCAAEDLPLLICVCVHVALLKTPGKTFSAVPISNAIVREELSSADTLLKTLPCRSLLELELGTGTA